MLDFPLLFESGMDRICYEVLCVHVDEDTQRLRLEARDAAGAEDARQRIAAQKLTAADKAAKADVVIDNNGSKEDLDAKLGELAPLLRKRTALQILVRPTLFVAAFFLLWWLPRMLRPLFSGSSG